MATQIRLNAAPRTIIGREVRDLRRQGFIPANVYGTKTKSFAVQVKHADFSLVYSQSGATGLINLAVTGSQKTHPVLITNVQTHPVTSLPLHVDFREVSLTEKVTANIAFETTGDSPAVKDLNGVLVIIHNELEVEALPAYLPDKFVLDISSLAEIGASLFVKDLKFDRKLVTLALTPEEMLVTIKPQEEEKVEEAPVEPKAEAETPESKPEAEAKTETPESKPEAKKAAE
ncbi:hypothetical protein A2W24_00300 [Microgenomates group bacterium RBG_16_45_19]|nr:MAG: hypothetical protein A2W24_00300 [Microgenomates group bacterium RBG_16_45_19]